MGTVSQAGGGGALSSRVGRIAARPDARFLFVITGLAFLFRIIVILSIQRGNNFAFNDAFFYHSVAAMAADGKGFSTLDGRPFGQWPPGYPFLLSLLYRFTGSNPLAGEFLNATLGAAAVPLIYAIAEKSFGKIEARFCAIAMAIMPAQIFFTDVLMSEPFFVIILLTMLWILASREPTIQTAAMAGVVMGIATLTRGEGPILLLMPLAAWLPRIPRRQLAERIAVVLGVAVLCVLPWTMRNYSTFHRFIPVSTNFGSTFWSGHNATATGKQSYPPPSLTAQAGPSSGRFYQIDQSKLLQKDAMNWIKAHPLQDLALIPWRMLGIAEGDGGSIYYWVNKTGNGKKPLNHEWAERLGTIADMGWFVLLTLFGSALAVFGRSVFRNSVLRAAIAYIAFSFLLYSVVLYGQFRYHVPMEPLMMLVAAPLVAQMVAVRRRRLDASRSTE
ncbi:MAG: glycosyltransferase family 39 protein [Solirubrobacterales bacterium]|nr:glycosyltransferase family 39 protein [Solirubrobacterales bacterium]